MFPNDDTLEALLPCLIRIPNCSYQFCY